MAPPRRPRSVSAARPGKPETPYQRRIRLYLERHPGATRQQARGKRAGPEYQRRVERAQQRYPGISRRAAGGRGTADEKCAMRLMNAIRRAGADTVVSFLGLDRQADGTWKRAGFDLLNGEMESFEFGGDALRLLGAIGDAIGEAGLMVLGAKYLQQMVEWAEGYDLRGPSGATL